METNGYRAVYEGGQGEIIEKKSRFIATVLPIETEEEALEFIAKMKKKYWDAIAMPMSLASVRSYKDVPMTENQTVPPAVRC